MKLSNLAVYQTPKMTWPSIVTEIGDVVAECYTNDKVVLAMAAAPEMLAALKQCSEHLNGIGPHATKEEARIRTLTNAAITKAEGGGR